MALISALCAWLAASSPASAETPAPDQTEAEMLFRLAFERHLDFRFMADTADLATSGVPPAVLARYAGTVIPLSLDARYHAQNHPKYTDDGITLTLSFDGLYECHFAWRSIRVVAFTIPDAPPGQE